jgi:Kdo2-lipid IVA lauroyltransferase/acyltransferase
MASRHAHKALRYRLEGMAITALLSLVRRLPRVHASALMGSLTYTIGRFLPVHRRARQTVARILPHANAAIVVKECWQNLGRVAAELPHLPALRCAYSGSEAAETADVVIEGIEHLQPYLHSDKPVIYISGHLGNWEVLSVAAGFWNKPFVGVYRAANNPYAEKPLKQLRDRLPGRFVAKGSKGARELLVALRNKENLGFLIDQRLSDGIEVPFFGHPAKTASAPVELAKRYGLPMVAAHCVRLPQSRFKVIVEKPILLSAHTPIPEALVSVNEMLERWIREQPGQWLWLHRRWSWKR